MLEQIEKDLDRTFPYNEFFEESFKTALHRVFPSAAVVKLSSNILFYGNVPHIDCSVTFSAQQEQKAVVHLPYKHTQSNKHTC